MKIFLKPLFVLLFITSSTLSFCQIESSTIKDFEYLNRKNTFIEEFNSKDILFKDPKPIGPSGDMLINSGEMKLSFKEKGDGLLFVAKTTPGLLDKENVEFEVRFKWAEDGYPFRAIFELGQRKHGQSVMKIDINQGRIVCIQKSDFGVIDIRGKLIEIYKKGEYNTINMIRYDNRVMLFVNGVMVGQSKYHPVKRYTYKSETVLQDKHDMRIKFIHPKGSVDYIKVAELSEKPYDNIAQNIEKRNVNQQPVQQTQPVVKNKQPVVENKQPVVEEKKPEVSKTINRSNDTGFNFSKAVSSDDKNTSSYSENIEVQGRFYAIIIGNNEYQDPNITMLDKPIKDAVKLYNLLTLEYTFEPKDVLFLKNATRTNIIEAFDALSNNLTPNDNLLIFYAGHGYWNEEKESGYWLPVDAKKSNTANWVRNSTIQGYLDEIPAKHTLLIADACFGGGIFKTRKAFEDAPPSIESLYKLKSRKGITSGMLNEVPDHSVFMEYLTKRLKENKEKYISTLDVFTKFRVAVMNNSDNTPQYGTIHNTGDEGGDFIFIRRRE